MPVNSPGQFYGPTGYIPPTTPQPTPPVITGAHYSDLDATPQLPSVTSVVPPDIVSNATSWLSNIKDDARGVINQAESLTHGAMGAIGQYVSNLTPVQRIATELGAKNINLGSAIYNVPLTNSIGSSLISLGKAMPAGKIATVVKSTGKDLQQVVPYAADVINDVTLGGVWQGLKSNVGIQPRAVDVLPGASILAKNSKSVADSYKAFDNTTVGKVFDNAYITALNAAQAGVVGGAFVNAVKPLTAAESAAQDAGYATRPLAWGQGILNPSTVKQALLVATGGTGVALAKGANRASNRAADAAESYNDLTQQLVDQGNQNLSNAKAAGNSNNGSNNNSPPQNITNYNTTNNNNNTKNSSNGGASQTPTSQDTSGSSSITDVIKSGIASIKGAGDAATAGITNAGQMWDTILGSGLDAAILSMGVGNNRSSSGGSSNPGGGSSRPLVVDKVAHKHKHKKIKPVHARSFPHEEKKLVRRAIQTGKE
jgi:hypothetical protein